MYKYFISYYHVYGFGMTVIETYKRICDMKDLEEIKQAIEDKEKWSDRVIILNFIELPCENEESSKQ